MTDQQGTVYVVDDEHGICVLVQRILEPHGPMIVTCPSANHFFQAFKSGSPACVLLDFKLGTTSGLEVLRDFRAAGFQTPVIMLTAYGSVPVAVESMKGGAFDFISKPFTPADLLDKVRAALDIDRAQWASTAGKRALLDRFAGLTPRELELLQAIVEGKSSKVIARELGISIRTVEHHRSAMLSRTGAHNFAHLVRIAVEAGIVTSSDKTPSLP